MIPTLILTGASSGLGRALAIEHARQGGTVGAIARRADRLASLVEETKSCPGKVVTAVADVTDRVGLHSAIASLIEKTGPPSLLIANAGVGLDSSGENLHVENVEQMIRVNFLGMVYAIEAVLPGMLERGAGHLVGVSSLASYKGLPGSAGYSASKAAVNNYLESLRIELQPAGIAVTTVCPGFIDTEMTADQERSMPMMLTSQEAAVRILTRLKSKPKVYDFPWQMRLLLTVARYAPDWYIRRKIRKAYEKGRSK